MVQVRVMHYLNQFFAGIGAEEKADVPLDWREGAVGPGKRLQALFGDSAGIAVTAYCGDNYFAEHTDEVLERILQTAKEQNIQMVVAGPAIAAGRFGFACVEVCHFLSTSLDIYGVTGMHAENPGVDGYKQYKDKKVFLLPTADTITGMEDALSRMARFILKLAAGSAMLSADEEGYIPRGIRLDTEAGRSGAERGIDMLLDRLSEHPFSTEIPIEVPEEVPIAPPVADIKDACIAIVSTTGVHPAGNPYGFKIYRNTQFQKYSIDKLNSMKSGDWEVVHGGYNAMFMNENPNYGVPLDACRALEKEGAFRVLYPWFYGTTGVEGLVSAMKDIGRNIVSDMKAEGVDAALLVST